MNKHNIVFSTVRNGLMRQTVFAPNQWEAVLRLSVAIDVEITIHNVTTFRDTSGEVADNIVHMFPSENKDA